MALCCGNSQVVDFRGLPGARAGGTIGFTEPPPPGWASRNAAISPILYRIVVPLIRRNGQPIFNRRSFCSTFTLHARIAAYTCSSTHAQGTAGTRVRSTAVETRFHLPAPTMSRTILGGGCGSAGVGASIAITSWVVRCRSGSGIAFSESPTTMSVSRSICCLAKSVRADLTARELYTLFRRKVSQLMKMNVRTSSFTQKRTNGPGKNNSAAPCCFDKMK
jgi:hypothetical protein